MGEYTLNDFSSDYIQITIYQIEHSAITDAIGNLIKNLKELVSSFNSLFNNYFALQTQDQ